MTEKDTVILSSGMNIVCVKWVDTAAYPGWIGSRDTMPNKPLEVDSVGWMAERSDESIVLAMSASEYKIGDLLVIPTRNILNVYELGMPNDGDR